MKKILFLLLILLSFSCKKDEVIPIVNYSDSINEYKVLIEENEAINYKLIERINLLNDSLTIYKDSVKHLSEKPLMNEDYFIKIYKYETIVKYYNIIKRKPSQEKYFKGWVFRVIEE
jgi:hypothetical protein